MKAFIQKNYGPPEQLTLTELPVPRPKAGEVLVKIHSAAVNDYDWAMVTGVPRIYRLLYGLRRPKHPIPGMEFSGTVASVGPGGSCFAPGDEVYGDISDPRLLQILLFGWLVRLITGKSMRIVALKPNRDLDSVRDLFVKGKLVSVLDGPHSMKHAPSLLRRFGEGRHYGKIVMHAAGLSASD